ncbi:MAG: leucyl aminopeptidase [Chloroflexota bacterium]
MKIKVAAGDIVHTAADAIIVSLFEGVAKPTGGATAAVDQALGGAITQLIADGEIKGKASEAIIIHTLGRIEPKRVAVLGLGKKEKLNLEGVRRGVAEACRLLRTSGAKKIAATAVGSGEGEIDPRSSAQAVVEGCLLGLYTFRQHRTADEDDKDVQEFWLVEQDSRRLPQLKQGVEVGKIMAEATNLARDLINQPSNYMTPAIMAQEAQKVAQTHGLSIKILEREEMREMGMGALLGVAQGSHNPPKFIILEYKGDGGGKPTLGLIGKGITFDSGGISLKPSEGMGDMKVDMSGAAAVLAAMQAIAQLKPQLNVTGLIPATENLPGGGALKPGDVLRALNHKTIEVISTDAEGRLILADALSYAVKQGLSPLLDLATLTGACRVALGEAYSGAFGNDEDFLGRVIKAGKAAGEAQWPMPLVEEYKEQIKSDVADIKNTGDHWGGAITGALFLAEFVGDTPWVHLDIAGPALSQKDKGYIIKGGSGVGVRTLVNLVLSLAEKQGG